MPDTIALSANAVAVLRFEIKGYRARVKGRRLPAYRELAAAGIMELMPGTDGDSEASYRFTEEGLKQREAILREAEIRIERERFAPPDAGHLSDLARNLLRRLISGERVEVNETSRPAYRELAAARIIFPVHTFAGGRDVAFRFTSWGWERRFEYAATTKEIA